MPGGSCSGHEFWVPPTLVTLITSVFPQRVRCPEGWPRDTTEAMDRVGILDLGFGDRQVHLRQPPVGATRAW